MRALFCFAMIVLLGSSCDSLSRDERLQRYLEDELNLNKDQFPTAIFIVTEEGCPTCNRAFADLVRPLVSTPHCLIIIRAEGRSVDLNGFLTETDQVRFDDNGSFKKLGLLEGSGLILLNESQVDTILKFEITDLAQQIAYASDLLESIYQAPVE
jgi:hypothetical protein